MMNLDIIKTIVIVLLTAVVLGVLQVLGIFDTKYIGPQSTLDKLSDEFFKQCKTYPTLQEFMNDTFLIYSEKFSYIIIQDLEANITNKIRKKYHIPDNIDLTPEQQQEIDDLLNSILLTRVRPCVINPLVSKYKTCENIHNNFSPFLTDFISTVIDCVNQVKQNL